MTVNVTRAGPGSLLPVVTAAAVDGNDARSRAVAAGLLARAGIAVADSDGGSGGLVVVLAGNEAFGATRPYAGMPRERVTTAVEAMIGRGRGRAVLVTDAGPFVHDDSDPERAAGRAADLAWWQHLAKRAIRAGVELNTIRCGYAPFLGHQLPPERETALLRRLVLRRPATEDDVVSGLRLLLSRGFGNVAGATLPLDGKMDAGIVPMPGGRTAEPQPAPRHGDPFDLTGRTVLLTGASSGIGAATAHELADRGADLVLVARREDKLDEVAERVRSLGCAATTIAADLSELASLPDVLERAWRAAGRLDAFVHVAGIVTFDVPGVNNAALRERTLRVNAAAYASLCDELVLRWAADRRGGAIAAVSSLSGLCAPVANLLSYGYSKAAMGLFTEHLATTAARYGIRANTVAPGFVRTPMTGVTNTDFLQATLDLVPTGRMSEPEEVAALLAFLVSPAADYVTGAHLLIDGGGRTLLGL